jgi:hypothetical protein
MSKWIVILKNNSGSDVEIEDLGITIANGTQKSISTFFSYDEVSTSEDLKTLVNAGTLVVNNGLGDLDSTDGVEYIWLENQWNTEEKYVQAGDFDHGGLTGRTDDDQHPISAITNLQEELDLKADLTYVNASLSAHIEDFHALSGIHYDDVLALSGAIDAHNAQYEAHLDGNFHHTPLSGAEFYTVGTGGDFATLSEAFETIRPMFPTSPDASVTLQVITNLVEPPDQSVDMTDLHVDTTVTTSGGAWRVYHVNTISDITMLEKSGPGKLTFDNIIFENDTSWTIADSVTWLDIHDSGKLELLDTTVFDFGKGLQAENVDGALIINGLFDQQGLGLFVSSDGLKFDNCGWVQIESCTVNDFENLALEVINGTRLWWDDTTVIQDGGVTARNHSVISFNSIPTLENGPTAFSPLVGEVGNNQSLICSDNVSDTNFATLGDIGDVVGNDVLQYWTEGYSLSGTRWTPVNLGSGIAMGDATNLATGNLTT